MGNLQTELKYSYNDVSIIPSILSNVCHRGECNPFVYDNMLPLFTAPMDTVVSRTNYKEFYGEGITPILPRTEDLKLRKEYAMNGDWAAFSLQEFIDIFCNEENKVPNGNNEIKALIDVANGHMACLYEAVRKAKRMHGNLITIMVGNIANPETYRVAAEAGVDYVRCGIGGGSGCLTSSNTSIHYPMASLINEIYLTKMDMIDRGANEDKLPKIIADGGIRNYSDIIKAIGLGADYVMCGSIFAKMFESAAIKDSVTDLIKIPFEVDLTKIKNAHMKNGSWFGEYNGEEICLGEITARFYGMASRDGQIAMNGSKTKTSEGISKKLVVEYTMNGWVKNFIDYMRSAMSYCGCHAIDEFKKYATLIVISNNTYNSVNK